jgi:hypothetical protein
MSLPARLRTPAARPSAAPPLLREVTARELARVSEQLYQLDLYATQFNRLYDPAFGWLGGLGYPADRRQDRTGAPLPFMTEDQWRMDLALLRNTATQNHLFAGFLSHLARFVGPVTVQFIRKGSAPGGATAGPVDADGDGEPDADPDAQDCQECWDEWCEENDWGQGESDREYENLLRTLVEGEGTLEWFKGARGKVPAVRQVEPELIRKPQVLPDAFGWADEDDWRWGLLTKPSDAETVLAMWVADPEGTGGRVVAADRFTRTKLNTPRSVKRGLSDFLPVAELLRKTAGLLDNMAHVAKLQAAIAWWEQFSTATQAQILAMAESLRNPIPAGVPIGFGQAGTTQPPSNPFGPPLAQEHYPAGSIPRTDAGRSVLPGPVSAPAGFIDVYRVVMQSIGFMFSLPDSFVTGQTDSFASALVSGSPLVRFIEGRQAKTHGHAKAVVMRVLALSEESGRLPAGISKRVKPLLTSRPVVIADEEKKARTRIALLKEGLDDPYDIIKDNDHDVEVCLANQAAFRKRRVEMGAIPDPAAAPGPRDPSATPPGSAGGDGSSPNRPKAESVDDRGNVHRPAGRPDGGRFAGRGGDDVPAVEPEDVADTHESVDGRLHASRGAAAAAAGGHPGAAVARVGRGKWLALRASPDRAAPARPVAGLSDADFAAKVRDAADARPHGFGAEKVYVADVFDALSAEDPSLTRAEFDRRLLAAHAAGLVELSRADLVQLMDPDVVRRSEVRHPSGAAAFHFLRAAARKRAERPRPAD